VKALREVEGLPQRAALEENNRTFKVDSWTPKKIDEILWT
jgi:hypothetical protein